MMKHLTGSTAAILAGGLGTRLRSVVADRPKALAPVHERPFITFLLDQLAGYGVKRVVLLTGYKAAQVRAALGDEYRDMQLCYSEETTPLGTGGAIRNAWPMLDAASLLVINGDSYCGANLAEFARFHCARAADISMVAAAAADCSRFGKIRIGVHGDILSFQEKQAGAGAGWINAGIYLLQTALIADIPANRSVSFEREMIPQWLAAGKKVAGLPSDAVFLDIGTPESYAQAEQFFAEQMLAPLATCL
jgi:NDP-sugar pyrophosphorylase family protein